MCVWECLDGWTLGKDGRAGWIELREAIGTVELRHRSIEYGRWCLKVYDIATAHDADFFDGVAYDWEAIPMIMGHAEHEPRRHPLAAWFVLGFVLGLTGGGRRRRW